MLRIMLVTAFIAAALIGGGLLLERTVQPYAGTAAGEEGPMLSGKIQENAKSSETSADASSDNASGPFYFIAIHCEPYHGRPGQEEMIARDYAVLKQMVDMADSYGIKLTLMFTPQWAEFIAGDPERMAQLEAWRESGHEIAAHHHGVHHGNWDGYTDYPEEVYSLAKSAPGRTLSYLGSLDDYSEVMRQLDPGMTSGCLNEEYDKAVLPDSFKISSCSGYLNYGEPGDRAERGSRVAGDGWNDFIVTGQWDGIERSWLTHYRITNGRLEQAVEAELASRGYGVYGAVTHSKANQADPYFYDFLEFLHTLDPEATGSVTLSQVVEEQLLPEKWVEVVQFGDGRYR